MYYKVELFVVLFNSSLIRTNIHVYQKPHVTLIGRPRQRGYVMVSGDICNSGPAGSLEDVPLQTPTHTRTYTHTYTQTHTHARTHTRTHTHTHTSSSSYISIWTLVSTRQTIIHKPHVFKRHTYTFSCIQ